MEAIEEISIMVVAHLQLILIIGIDINKIMLITISATTILIIYRRSKIFWTDDSYNRIWMANLDGSNATVLISSSLSCPGEGFVLLVNTFMCLLLAWLICIKRWNSMGLDQ